MIGHTKAKRLGPANLFVEVSSDNRLLAGRILFEVLEHNVSVLLNAKDNDERWEIIDLPREGVSKPDKIILEPLESIRISIQSFDQCVEGTINRFIAAKRVHGLVEG